MSKRIKKRIGKKIKKLDDEAYVFRNGVAEVPGMFHSNGSRYRITMSEFNDLNGRP